MRRHLINRCIDLIESSEGLTKNHHPRLNSEAFHIMGCEVLFDCDSPMHMTGSFQEQKIAAAWRYRRENSMSLALKMKLFKSSQFPVSLDGNNFYSSHYVATQFGKFFRKSPAFIQTVLIAIYMAVNRASDVATRFKWVTGIVSFGALAIKVWHSDLISNWWIALSAVIGLAIGFLSTLWR
ncbi:hypothetical protein ACEOIM_08925 [Pseudomonas aeruginosa]|nr:hypothetical protein [Pseudomonas aeruginosa]RUC92498.1 hypothetical protein IPC1387_35095 [Pseudomonas aeruginosa]HBO2099782.1 hypothetical protein [Pseudomonas aeruginosa]HBP0076513.1 hypothetical protein [Pseudomonas aeruginosa]HCH6841388.1 hypothetical protein [Pseudomonas aeruginosa]